MRWSGGRQRARSNREQVVIYAMIWAVVIVTIFIFYESSQIDSPMHIEGSPLAVLSRAYKDKEMKSRLTPLRDSEFDNNQTFAIPEETNALVRYIWTNYLIVYSNSESTYNLDNPFIEDPSPKSITQNIVRHFFDNKVDGVFVEYRARDGEAGSYSLYLEIHMGWRGLLIEPDRKMYQQLLEKNRKVWMSNTCISSKPHPYWGLIDSGTVIGDVLDVGRKPGEIRSSDENADVYQVQCLPLHNMLVAVEFKEIDILFLDEEMDALDILLNINLDLIPTKVIVVVLYDEVSDGVLTMSIRNFLSSKGYRTRASVVNTEPEFVHRLVFNKK